MVNNLVFRWPKPLLFMGLAAHGSSSTIVQIYVYINRCKHIENKIFNILSLPNTSSEGVLGMSWVCFWGFKYLLMRCFEA